MALKNLFPKAGRLFSFSIVHRTTKSGDFLESLRWASSTITGRTTPRHGPDRSTNPFFERACNEETTPLSLRRKRSQHIVCEETLLRFVHHRLGKKKQQQQRQQAEKETQQGEGDKQGECGSNNDNFTMGRSGQDTTKMDNKSHPESQPSHERCVILKTSAGTTAPSAQDGAVPMAERKKDSGRQSRPHRTKQSEGQQQKLKENSTMREEYQVHVSNMAMDGPPIPSLEGRGWTFWF